MHHAPSEAQFLSKAGLFVLTDMLDSAPSQFQNILFGVILDLAEVLCCMGDLSLITHFSTLMNAIIYVFASLTCLVSSCSF